MIYGKTRTSSIFALRRRIVRCAILYLTLKTKFHILSRNRTGNVYGGESARRYHRFALKIVYLFRRIIDARFNTRGSK